MKDVFTVHQANNGIILKSDEYVEVMENTHNADGKGYQVGLGSLRFLFVKVGIIKYVHELQHILWALGLDANLTI